MDPLAEEVELLDPVDNHDQLAVDHEALTRQRQHLRDHLREVAVHRPPVATLEVHVVAVAEHDRAKPVPLRLEPPAVAVRQVLRGLRELGCDGGLEG